MIPVIITTRAFESLKSMPSDTFPRQTANIMHLFSMSGQAMQELRKLGARSIIMTSGTLSPMNAFRDDLNIPIAVQLENPHVISRSQIYVGALAVGPTGKQLNSSYNVRDTNDYKDELGTSIFMICHPLLLVQSSKN